MAICKLKSLRSEKHRMPFAEFMMQEDNELPAFMQQQINDIRLIQERYAWFLDGVFAGRGI